MKVMKLLLVAGAAMVGVVLLAVVLALVFVPKKKIIALAVPPLETALDRRVAVGDVGLSLWPVLGVRLADCSISNTRREGFDTAAPFLRLKGLRVSVDIFALLRKEILVKKIVLDAPEILVEVGADGSFNYTDMPALAPDTTQRKKSTSDLPPLQLSLLQIQNGSIRYVDHKAATQFSIGDIDQKLTANGRKNFTEFDTKGTLSLREIAFASRDIPAPVKGLAVTITHDVSADMNTGLVTVRSIRASLQKVFVNITGTVEQATSPEPLLNLGFQTDPIDIASLLAEIPPSLYADIRKVAGSGTAQAAVSAKGKLVAGAPLPLSGSLSLKNVAIQYEGLPKSVTGLNADIAFTPDMLDIRDLALRFGDHPVSAKMLVENFARPKIDGFVKADINLDDLKNLIVLPAGYSASGSMNADIAAKGEVDPADPYKLDLKGSLLFTNASFMAPPVVKPIVLNGTVGISNLEIQKNLAISIGRSSMTIKASLTNFLSLILPSDSVKSYPRTVLAGTIAGPVLDVDEFLPPPPPAPAGTTPAPVSDEPLLLPAPLPPLDVKCDFSFGSLVYSGLAMSGASGRIDLVRDVAKIAFGSGFYGGRMKTVLGLDMVQCRDIGLTIGADMTDVDLNTCVSTFNDKLDNSTALNRALKNTDDVIFGTASFRADLVSRGGRVSELQKNLRGTFFGTSGQGRIASCTLFSGIGEAVAKFVGVNDIEYRSLKLNARIADERVYVDTLLIPESKSGDFAITGDVGFNAAYNLAIDERLPASVSSKLIGAQGAAKGAVVGAAAKNLGAVGGLVGGLIDKIGIPSDKDGRVTLLLGVKGDAMIPKVSFNGFKKVEGGQGVSTPADAKKAATAQVKAVAQQKVEEVKTQAKEIVTQKAEVVKQEVEKKVEQQIGGAATKKAEETGKKLLKKIW